tara:strand:+ start:447 stop:587 length:141 start_codon:yes stop_codon:yes gene_type:complete
MKRLSIFFLFLITLNGLLAERLDVEGDDTEIVLNSEGDTIILILKL